MSNSVEKQFQARMGLVTISTSNSNLDGTGTISTLITGAGAGTLVKTIIVKALSDTTHGMIRLFLKKPLGSYNLL